MTTSYSMLSRSMGSSSPSTVLERPRAAAGVLERWRAAAGVRERRRAATGVLERWRAAAGVHRRAIVLRAVDKLRRRVAVAARARRSILADRMVCCVTDCVQ
mmetsp:Transcript_24326/g.63406  ORF Transcript_24326/g.63406 Transcript_24326/m.63406 type:complete len:102 (-) Transcript_24326:43-348(-)